MSRRKTPSKRRIKARFAIGYPIYMFEIRNYGLVKWLERQPHTYRPVSECVLKIFRGSNA